MASSSQGGGGSAQRGRDDDETTTQGFGSKKARPSNRRVSFGGAHVRMYEKESFMAADRFASPSLEPVMPRPVPTPPRPSNPRGLPFDDAGESTLPLPNPGDPGLPVDSLDLFDDSMRLSTEPSMMRMSGNFDFEDFDDGSARAPRFSVVHGVDDNSEDDDVTVQPNSAKPPTYPTNPPTLDQHANSEPRSRQPRPSRPVHAARPSLPAKRQLFAGDEEEDATVHYTSSAIQPPTSILKSASRTIPEDMTVSPSVTQGTRRELYAETPPHSALGSRIRAAALEKSGKKLDASNTDLSIHGNDDTVMTEFSAPVEEKKFPLVERFLSAFWPSKHTVDVARPSSMSPKPDTSELQSFNMDELSGQLGACVTKRAFVDSLDKEIADLKLEIARKKGLIADVSSSLENERPDLLRSVTDALPAQYAQLKPALSRLQRHCSQIARANWYQRRKAMEEGILAKYDEANGSLERDAEVCNRLKTKFEGHRQKLEETVTVQFSDSEVQPASEESLQELQENIADLESLRSNVQVEKNKEDMLKASAEETGKKCAELEKEIEQIRESISNPVKAIERDNREVLARKIRRAELTGIDTKFATAEKLIVRLVNCGDAHIDMKNLVPLNLVVKPLPLTGLPPQMRAFVHDSATLVSSCITNVGSLKELPTVLHLMVTNLLLVRQACKHAGRYMDQHDLELLETPLDSNDCEYSELRLYPRYFSEKKWMKFGVVVAIKFYPPIYNGEKKVNKLGSQSITAESVEAIVGKAPSLAEIQKTLEDTPGDLDKKMGALWQFCE